MPSARPVFADPPVLCGHRGSGRGVVGGELENTLGSYRAAVEAGVRWVEVDARINADDVLVARHDPIVDDGRFIAELASAETDALGLMRVEDLLEEMPAEVAVNVEVKSSLEDATRPRERTTAALVADLARREGERRRLLVSSFDPSVLMIVRERSPDTALGFLTWLWFPLRKAIAAAAHMGVEVVAPHVGSFHLGEQDAPALDRPPEKSVRVAHEAGLEVLVWCPEPSEAEQLAAAGADCLVVDDVPAVVARG
jgi:glycerophosphoryl diester phosphodiesterase